MASSNARNKGVCPVCGGVIRPDTTDGHCPTCLLDRLSNLESLQPLGAEPSTTLADYELEEIIGRGGMGVVWRARQKKLNRRVAVKFLVGGGWSSEAARGRLRAEAIAAARLRHPGIVPVFDLGESHDGPWLSMEYVPGQTLAAKLDAGPLELRAAAALMLAIVQAVAHAHQQGVLHRDLKPGNILIDNEGRPHVSDFGLARVAGADSTLTQTGQILGSPAYLAPEILQGEPATEVGDVYALGATLYHAITGRPPFEGPTVEATLRQVAATEPIPPRRLRRGIPADLETIVLVCVQKSPARRYASATQLADDLARFLHGHPIAARPVSVAEKVGRWCRRHPAASGLLALVVLGTVASFWRINALRDAEQRERARAEQSLAALQVKTHALAAAETNLAASNTRLTESLERLQLERTEDLFEQNRLSEGLLSLARLLEARPPSRLAAARLAGLLWHQDVARLAGVPEFFFEKMTRVLATPAQPFALAGAESGRLWLLQPNPSSNLWSHRSIEGLYQHDRMALSRDESTLALISRADDTTALILHPTRLEDHPTPLAHGAPILAVCLATNGAIAVTVGHNGGAIWWRTDSGEKLGQIQPGQPVQQVLLTANGQQLVTAADDGSVCWWNGSHPEPIARDRITPGQLTALAATINGERVAAGTDAGNIRIWSSPDGARPLPSVSLGSRLRALGFSSDGRILAAGTAEGRVRLIRVPGGDPVAEDLQLDGGIREFVFSGDGRQLAICSDSARVTLLEVATGRPLQQSLRHAERAPSAAFFAGDQVLLVASAEGTVRKWDLRPSRWQTPILAEPGPDASFAGGILIRRGTEAITWSSHGVLRRWSLDPSFKPSDVLRLVPPPPLFQGAGRITFVVPSPDDSHLALGFAAGSIRLLHLQSNAAGTVPISLPLDDAPLCAAFSPDGHWIAAGASRGSARIWRVDDGSPGPPIPPHRAEVRAIAFSPNGEWLVTVSHDRNAHLVRWQEPEAKPIVARHRDAITSAAITADNVSVVTASQDRSVVLWDLLTGSRRRTLHQGTIERLVLSPNSRVLAMIPGHGNVQLQELSTGRPSQLARNLAAGVMTASFSPDGQRIATGGRDGSARVWDVASGLPLTPPLRHGAAVRTASFFPDGLRLFTVSQDGTARIWPVPAVPDAVPPWAARLSRLLAGELTEDERSNPLFALQLWAQMEAELRAAPESDPLGSVARWFGARFP